MQRSDRARLRAARLRPFLFLAAFLLGPGLLAFLFLGATPPILPLADALWLGAFGLWAGLALFSSHGAAGRVAALGAFLSRVGLLLPIGGLPLLGFDQTRPRPVARKRRLPSSPG